VSGDVHQQQFEIGHSTGTIEPGRIGSEDPTSGRWAIRVTLVARPAGELPKLVAGASPAYPLPRYPSSFDQLDIVPRDPTELLDALRALSAPSMTDIDRLLGAADRDIGSGIHIFEYQLDAATTIRVGTSDRVRVMYIRVGDRDLFRAR
jgi:hypothetical protein